jgi:hypothetical protein
MRALLHVSNTNMSIDYGDFHFPRVIRATLTLSWELVAVVKSVSQELRSKLN